MKFSLKNDWIYVVLVIVGVWALGQTISFLWSASSQQPASCWFNKLFHKTGVTTGPAAQGSKDSPSECCGPVPASAGVCDHAVTQAAPVA